MHNEDDSHQPEPPGFLASSESRSEPTVDDDEQLSKNKVGSPEIDSMSDKDSELNQQRQTCQMMQFLNAVKYPGL